MPMINAAKILKAADQYVLLRDRWASLPSTDIVMCAVVETVVAAANAEIRDTALRLLGAIAIFASGDVEKFNYALEEIRTQLTV